jgi:hypothetical protein
MSRSLENNALELFRLNISITILVKEMESLSYPLSLQPPEHLRELWVGEIMSSLLAPTVEGSPFTIPIKRYAIWAFVYLIQALQIVIFHRSRPVQIEKPKGNLVFSVRLCKQVLEPSPVQEIDPACSAPVRNAEEDGILLTLDLVLYGKTPHQPVTPDSLVQWRAGDKRLT